ncbi:MAG: hypothetical protein H6916_08970 [Novosphingobium sp.]|jgi:hypothetical protein|uniref:hypothetical protein n=1 Tax=Novosphingobium sp. TaxID=1874826 RepID=UPI001D2A4EEB|nr:hypothetical protein [Novosphingobium sp.]MCB2057921.1 hypothetical protein [Novosphingobium sp.]MCP5386928.1 hypothetical protein [Novosphingobium sp.]
MNRIFLAILALFAGFAAQVSPASARISGVDTEIGAVECRQGVRCIAPKTDSGSSPAPRPERRPRECVQNRLPRSPVYIPSVLFGVDRAFE